MKFTRLRLSGFKSFVDPTELHIEAGLTGVVGPNGCGKSNLLEAMRWVMGENRPTSVRGTGMDDVIFGGTGSRAMRNNAEVTLIIDNGDRTAPAPYNEFDVIEISRRIEREAGSIYRINGREVRQRDVQIFFADAASGATSPSLVRQGQISVIINQKPLARRAILEEAAGIAGLHQRRHEAELRLKAAEANMGRLNDIITEVEGQLQGLKRQARQAARYRNLSGLIRKAEALAFLLRWQAAQAQEDAAVRALAEATARVAEHTSIASRATTARADAADALPPLRQHEAERSAALQRLLHERNSLDADESRAREEAQRLRQRIAQAEQDEAREHGLEQDAATALGALDAEAQDLARANERSSDELATAEHRARELSEALAERERILESLTADLADLNASRTGYERARSQAAAQVARAEGQLEVLAPGLAAAEAESAGAPDLRAAEQAVEAARGNVAAAQTASVVARDRERIAAAAEAETRGPFDAAENEAQRLAAEAGALAKLLRRTDSDLWPPIIDSLRVAPGYEAALAAALGDDLEAPLNEAAPQHWRELGALAAPALPDGAVALSQFVQAPPALARRLAFTGVIAREAGAAAQSALRAGQRLVSQRGDLWRWDGFRVSAEAQSAAAMRLEQRNRLATLEGECTAAKAVRAEKHAAYTAAQKEAAFTREALRLAEEAFRESDAMLIAAQDHAAATARAAGERVAALAAMRSEQRNLQRLRDEARQAEKAAGDAIAALADGATLEAHLKEAKGQAAEARANTGAALGEVEILKRGATARAQRRAALDEERSRWMARRDAATAKIAELAGRIAGMRAELDTAENFPLQIEVRRNGLLEAVGRAEEARKNAAEARAGAEGRLTEADKAVRAAEQALGEAREERAAAQAHAEAFAARLTELRLRIRDELDAQPQDLEARAELKGGAELPPLEDADKRVEKLKAEREQLGGVNLRAEEEAAEHEQRLNSLTADRADLDGAVQRLRRGIQSLNRQGRERLLESFEKVNANFEKLFKELFLGGEARLTFTESDDPLEAGLEILARPPGKKLTTLSLLSGGEQALTAIALIFAVFLVNPAPICVLDEVDAPLDDANVDRFCRLLDEMTRRSETRYLIISHHALTMSRMNRLFGVTMAERGVSQLVSVSLAEAERVAAA